MHSDIKDSAKDSVRESVSMSVSVCGCVRPQKERSIHGAHEECHKNEAVPPCVTPLEPPGGQQAKTPTDDHAAEENLDEIKQCQREGVAGYAFAADICRGEAEQRHTDGVVQDALAEHKIEQLHVHLCRGGMLGLM